MSVLRIDPELDDETLGNTIENAHLWQYISDSEDDKTIEEELTPPNSSSISFDVSTGDYAECLITKVFKNKGYINSSNSRTIMVAYKPNDTLDVVKWTINSILNDNDILVVIEVIPLHNYLRSGFNYNKDKENLFESMKSLIGDKCVEIVYERRVGAVYYAINRAINDYEVTMVVIGNGEYNKEMIDKCKVGVIIVNDLEIRENKDDNNNNNNNLKTLPTIQSLTYAITSTPLDLPTKRTSRFLRGGNLNNLLSPVSSNESIRSLSPFKLFKRK